MNEKLKNEVLEKIKPKKEEKEQVTEVAKEIVSLVEREIGTIGKCTVVGSIVKGTFLSNDRDVDIFVIFKNEMSTDKLRNEVQNIGKRVFGSFEEKYAQHPYIHAHYRGMEIDLVPAFEFKGRIKSSVDRTPEHTQFVLRRIRENEGLKNEILLLKQFAKGINLYGAESKVQGFSGYLCELFIIRYQSLEGFLEAAKTFEKGTMLTLGESAKEKKRKEWNQSPLIFVDPVDSRRNVASSLSEENIELLKEAASAFLKDPKITFFFPNEPPVYKKINTENLIAIDLSNAIKLRIEDIYFSQLRRAMNLIKKQLEEFGVEKSGIFCNGKRALIFFKLNKMELQRKIEHEGPPISMKAHAKKFIEKWGKERCYTKNMRVYTVVEREDTRAKRIIEKSFEFLKLGKGINNKKIEILEDIDLNIKQDPELKKFLRKLLSNKRSWEF